MNPPLSPLAPGSQREESPRGEELRAAGARESERPGDWSRPQPAEPVAGAPAGRRSRTNGSDGFVRWRAHATHKGDGLGIPATGRPADFRGMTWLTFKDGLIVEGWDSWNLGKLLESLK